MKGKKKGWRKPGGGRFFSSTQLENNRQWAHTEANGVYMLFVVFFFNVQSDCKSD